MCICTSTVLCFLFCFVFVLLLLLCCTGFLEKGKQIQFGFDKKTKNFLQSFFFFLPSLQFLFTLSQEKQWKCWTVVFTECFRYGSDWDAKPAWHSAVTRQRQKMTGRGYLQALGKIKFPLFLNFLWRLCQLPKSCWILFSTDTVWAQTGFIYRLYVIPQWAASLSPPPEKEWLNLAAARSTEFNQGRIIAADRKFRVIRAGKNASIQQQKKKDVHFWNPWCHCWRNQLQKDAQNKKKKMKLWY